MSRILASLALALALAGPAAAAGPEDLQLFYAVSDEVKRYVFFTIFDSVHIGIDEGVVTLSGKVTRPHKGTDLERRVAKVPGVREVRNDIEVLPVSRFDDQLRIGIARAIYSHPALSRYGLGLNPSIHVVVGRGRVTLEGVVQNDQDRLIARAVAGQFSTFALKNELKTEEEVRRDLEKL